MVGMVDDLLTDIRAWLAVPGNTKAKLSRLTGLHRNTLLACDRDDWNPTLEIVRKVEAQVRSHDAPDLTEQDERPTAAAA